MPGKYNNRPWTKPTTNAARTYKKSGTNSRLTSGRKSSSTTVARATRGTTAVRVGAMPSMIYAGPELKRVDTMINNVFISVVPGIIPVNSVSQASSNYNRIGMKISGHAIRARWNIGAALGGSDEFNVPDEVIRVALVYDSQANGVAPAYSDIWQAVDNTGSTSYVSGQELPNFNNTDRFVILRDKILRMPQTVKRTVVMPGGGNTTVVDTFGGEQATTDCGFDEWYVSIKDLPIQYKSASLGVAAIAHGAFYFIYASKNVFTSSRWSMSADIRFTYFDT